MLERIREGAQGPWAMVIIGLIVLSFVFAGVGSYLTSPASSAAATVNGEEISAQDLERAYQNQRAQMEARFGEGVSALFSDPSYLAQYKSGVLDSLIGDVLLKQHAESLGLRASDQQVKEAIVSIPQFQFDGKFDNERYKTAIAQSGFQPNEFRDYIRREMTRDQLSRAIGGSVFVTDSVVSAQIALEQQTRDANTLVVSASSFVNDVEVTQEDIEDYYNANLTRFDTEEQVELAYVELKVSDLQKNVEADAQDVLNYYEDNIVTYQTPETRSVSHILVEFNDDKDAALEKINGLKARIEQGEDFADVASAESDDTFSAEEGGDLGELSEGMMGEDFEAAAFAIVNEGDVSDVVETQFGYHLIKVTQINESSTAPFDEVKVEIEETLARDLALEQFYELQTLMAELAFEVPDSLDDVANELNQEVKTTGLFSNSTAPLPFNRSDILLQAFSPDLVELQVNSEVIEIDSEHLVVIRVINHEPQRTRTLEEVSDDISATLIAEKSQDAARTWAQTFVQTYQEDNAAAQGLLEEKGFEWTTVEAISRNSSSVDRALSNLLFTLADAAPNNIDLVDLASGDVGVGLLTAVNSADAPSDEVFSQFRQRLIVSQGNATIASLIESLKSEAEITIAQVNQ